MTIVQSFEEFYALNRKADEPDHSFLRGRAAVSNRQMKAQDSQYKTEVDAKYDEKEVLRAIYVQKVADGEICTPSHIEKLIERAKGNPDNLATQAAKRLLEKYGVNHE